MLLNKRYTFWRLCMIKRISEYEIEPLLLNRWSPRAFSGEPLSQEKLLQLFEAARWAPSSYNNQPWRFVYAHRDISAWNKLFNLLVPFNQSWADKAAVLILACSAKNFTYNNKPSRTHSFDTGAACQNLALQATAMGLIVHGMEGFDYDRARTELDIPDDWTVEAMFAVGYPGKKSDLSPELQKREEPSERNALTTFIFEGKINSHV